MLILTLHIIVATVMTTAIATVFVSAYRRRETAAYIPMMGSFAATIASGIGLLFVSPAGLGRLCAMMSVFTLTVILVRAYYRRRVILAPSL